MKKILFLFYCFFAPYVSFALDDTYHYSFDISQISDRKLHVELIPPQLSESKIVFSLPKIVPGTYSIYDFGRFAEDFKAYDAAGNLLQVTRIDTNSWEISKSNTLAKITYSVNDTYHPKRRSNPIFEPAGTDFEPDTCYLLNLHTLLGYFRGHTKQPYELNVYDVLGKLVKHVAADANVFEVQRDKLASGMYMYEVLLNGMPVGKGKLIAE